MVALSVQTFAPNVFLLALLALLDRLVLSPVIAQLQVAERQLPRRNWFPTPATQPEVTVQSEDGLRLNSSPTGAAGGVGGDGSLGTHLAPSHSQQVAHHGYSPEEPPLQ